MGNARYEDDIKVACRGCHAPIGAPCVGTTYPSQVHFGRRLRALATERATREGRDVKEILEELEEAIGG